MPKRRQTRLSLLRAYDKVWRRTCSGTLGMLPCERRSRRGGWRSFEQIECRVWKGGWMD